MCGVVALIAISLAEDDDDTVQSASPVTIFGDGSAAAATSQAEPPSTTAAVTTSITPPTSEGNDDPPTSSASTETPASTAAPTTSTTSTTIAPLPENLKPLVAVRVLNGGAGAGQATATTELLADAGFSPLSQADTEFEVAATTVLYAPDRQSDARAVNEVIGAAPGNVRLAPQDDPNWDAFGGDLHVLVVLGPPG